MEIRPNQPRKSNQRGAQAMTLIEVLVSFAISGLMVAGIVYGYVYSISSAERFALSQAANAQASERMEQVRSAPWYVSSAPVIDQVVSSNFSNEMVTLDLSGSGTGVTYATNYVYITTISSNPPLRGIHVDCVWVYGTSQLMTNSIETCRAPDQ